MRQFREYGMTFVRITMEQQREELPSAIGPYSILQSLGRGGMGEVFLATDPMCGRKVALKRIRPELNSNKTRTKYCLIDQSLVAEFLKRASMPHHIHQKSV